jgi:hypothetical protein
MCYYVGTFILSGYSSPLFFIVGGVVVSINLFTMFVYAQAEREIAPILSLTQRKYNTLIENYIIGVDTITSLKKVDKNRQAFMDCLYNLCVCRANNRWALQGLSMVCDLTGLVTTFATAAFAIDKKTKSNPRINIIGTAISMSNKLISISSKIARDIGTVETQMRISVVQSL